MQHGGDERRGEEERRAEEEGREGREWVRGELLMIVLSRALPFPFLRAFKVEGGWRGRMRQT